MTVWNLLVATLGFLVGFICRELVLRERFIVYEKRIDMYLATWARIAEAYAALKQLLTAVPAGRGSARFQEAQESADSSRWQAFMTLEKNRLILDEILYGICDQLLRKILTQVLMAGAWTREFEDQQFRKRHEAEIDDLYDQAERQARRKVQGWTRRLELFTDKCRRLAKAMLALWPWSRKGKSLS